MVPDYLLDRLWLWHLDAPQFLETSQHTLLAALVQSVHHVLRKVLAFLCNRRLLVLNVDCGRYVVIIPTVPQLTARVDVIRPLVVVLGRGLRAASVWIAVAWCAWELKRDAGFRRR